MRSVAGAWRAVVGLSRRPALRRALLDAGVEVDRVQVRLVRVRPGDGWHRIARLAAAGLTPGLVVEAGHWRWGGGMQANVCAVARLVAAGHDPKAVARCLRAGCAPLVLEGALGSAWPGSGSGPRRVLPGRAREAGTVLAAAGAGFLAGRGAGAWTRAAAVAARLLAEGVEATPDRVEAWMAASEPGRPGCPGLRELTRLWFEARPEQADPAAWADQAVRWAAAGISPADGVRLFALPAGHPDLPTAQDLAVMAALRS